MKKRLVQFLTGKSQDDERERERAKLRKRRDELAERYYGAPYKELCSVRREIIDQRIKEGG